MARCINRFGEVLTGALLGGLTFGCSAPEGELQPLASATTSASASFSTSGRSSTSASASAPGSSSASVSASGSAPNPSASLTSSASALPSSTTSVAVPSASVTLEVPDAATGDAAGDAGDAGVSPIADAEVDAAVSPTVSPTASATVSPTASATVSPTASAEEDAAVGVDAADESDAGGDDSSVSEPDASVAVGTVNVTCDWGDSATASELRVEPAMTLTNLDSAALSLSTVEVRYYFSADGQAATVSSDIYFTTASTAQDTIETSPGVGADADHYLSVKFVGCNGAGCTLPDGDSAVIQTAIIVNNGGASFDALNDYSYGGGVEDPCDSVVVLSNGTVIFGNLPTP